MKALILDDTESVHQAFTKNAPGDCILVHTYTVEETLEKLSAEKFDVLFLDYDLWGYFNPSGQGSGYDVALWLEKNPQFRPKRVIIHSANLSGAEKIFKLLPYAEKITGVQYMRSVLYVVLRERKTR